MNVREDNVAKFLDGLVFGVGDGHDPGDVRCQTRQLRMAANCIEDGAGSRIRSRGGGHRPIIAPPWGLTSRIAADQRLTHDNTQGVLASPAPSGPDPGNGISSVSPGTAPMR